MRVTCITENWREKMNSNYEFHGDEYEDAAEVREYNEAAWLELENSDDDYE